MIGEILVGLGRITESDVGRALEYQRDNGGNFGEALLACGFVSEEELEWGLASQFDLPYVFPEVESIDPEAAALVSPEWALANLALPILMTDDVLTVIVESPLKTDVVEELRARTDREVQVALAASSKIRELIRQVYARGAAADEEHRAPIAIGECLDMVLDVKSRRFGISVRGLRSAVWWDDRGTIRRRPLAGDWLGELERMMTPGPRQRTRDRPRAQWDAELSRAGIVTPLAVRYLADEAGAEYVFEPGAVKSGLQERFAPPPAGILSEVRLLARSGEARFIVTTEPESLGPEVLPHLPALLLDPTWRSIHVHARDRPTARDAFSLPMPQDPEHWSQQVEALRAFQFDVVTVDLTGGSPAWARGALEVAPTAFLLWKIDEDIPPAHYAGIRWRLHLVRDEEGQLGWSLTPLRGGDTPQGVGESESPHGTD